MYICAHTCVSVPEGVGDPLLQAVMSLPAWLLGTKVHPLQEQQVPFEFDFQISQHSVQNCLCEITPDSGPFYVSKSPPSSHFFSLHRDPTTTILFSAAFFPLHSPAPLRSFSYLACFLCQRDLHSLPLRDSRGISQSISFS